MRNRGRALLPALQGCVPVALLLSFTAWANAHEPVLLDPNRATPGVHLELVAVFPTQTEGSAPGYRLVATGFPTGVIFDVWTKRFGHSFHKAASGLHVDSAGRLVSLARDAFGGIRYLDDTVFQPDEYPRGTIWQVALASPDLTITAFATVIPRPIVVSNGPCIVSLELVSYRGDRFLASGIGFPPGDNVTVESRYSGHVRQKKRRASADGALPPDVIWHASLGDDRSAQYSVRGRSCEMTLEYEWGDAALRGR
jgi:hypothetical protein